MAVGQGRQVQGADRALARERLADVGHQAHAQALLDHHRHGQHGVELHPLAGRDAQGLEVAVGEFAAGELAVIAHQGPGAQQLQRVLPGIGGWHEQHQGLLAQGGPGHGLGQVERGLEAQGRIQGRLHQGGVEVGRQADADADAHAVVAVDEGAHDVRQKTMQGGVHGAQAQLSRIRIARDPLPQAVAVLHQLPAALEQAFPGRGGPHAAAVAHQQDGAQRLLQHAHLLGHGGGADVELTGGFGHGAALDDLQEIVNVSGVHHAHFLSLDESCKGLDRGKGWSTLWPAHGLPGQLINRRHRCQFATPIIFPPRHAVPGCGQRPAAPWPPRCPPGPRAGERAGAAWSCLLRPGAATTCLRGR
ncbi:hypothetical protein D3C78_1091940 [compost metagenome]